MKLRMYEFYDSKTESWSAPFFQATRGDAERLFRKLVTDTTEGNNIWLYPADFTFFECGEFDLSTGVLVQYDTKFNLGLALEYKPKD